MRLAARGVVVLLFLSILFVSQSQAQTPAAHGSAGLSATGSAATRPHVPQVIVKLRPQFAGQVETLLPLATMALTAGTSGNAAVDGFMSQYSAKRMSPVYAGLVRTKKQRHVSEAQIVSELRSRFGRRAVRARAGAAPPELARTYVLELSDADAGRLAAIVDALERDNHVEWAEEDHVTKAIYVPNDPYFSGAGTWGQPYDDLWGTKVIGAPAAWDTTRGDGVVVAVVDTGIDPTHPDIQANLWINAAEVGGCNIFGCDGIDHDGNGYADDSWGWDFIGSSYLTPTQSNNPVDHFGHGSHVAGTIAAIGDNATGIVGVAWHAHVMAVKGLDDNGYGLDSTLGPAILYAANNGADVINNSWSGTGSSQTIADAISYAYSLGVVVTAAAGNDNDDARNYYPANLWNVITIGATNPPVYNESLAYFSNWGSKIDVTAPGVDILSLRAAGTSMGTPVDAYYTRASGTSMATPHVSGAAALILSQHPEYSNEDVRQVLRVSATDRGSAGFDLDYGYGRISAAGAMTVANPLEAKISSPIDGTHVKALTTISGVAQGATLSSYTLEYGAGHLPTAWTTIQSGASPVSGTLGTFDPSTLIEGVYVVRLTAYNSTGQGFVDRIELIVDYVNITSPAPPAVPTVAAEYKPGALISVVGTAIGGSFQNFTVDWAEGINPSSGWGTAGVTLTGGGTAPITNDVVATWDTSSVTQADYYTVRLTVNNAAYSSQATTVVYLEPDLISSGWPKWLDQAPALNSGFVPALNADGSIRLTLMNPIYGNTSLPAKYWWFAPDGSSQYTALINYGDYMQPAAADFDGTPGQESIITEAGAIAVFHPDNSLTRLYPTLTANFQNALPVLEDLNGDSEFEVVALGSDLSSQHTYVFAWRRDGQQLNSNFPITLIDLNSNLWFAHVARVLVGDIDGDGQREIIVQEGTTSSTFRVRVFAPDGTVKTGWPNPTFNGYATNMVLADLDHNGALEIILVVTSGAQTSIHVLQPDGSERPGWPMVPSSGVSQLAVGDLNRDGREEIVAVGGAIYAWNADGTSFSGAFPINAPDGFQQFAGLALADVDGNGKPEILTVQNRFKSTSNPLLPQLIVSRPTVAADGTIAQDSPRVDVPNADAYPSLGYYEPVLLAIRNDGTTWKSWRLMGANGNQPYYDAAIAVGDFKQDGTNDIGITYFTISGGGTSGWMSEGVATVLTTGSPFAAAIDDWPLVYRNARNTALLRRDHTPPSVAITYPTGGVVNASTTVAITATDNDEVTRVEFYVDGTLHGTTTVAPFTVNWDTTAETSGLHSLTAKAYDPSGNVGSSSTVQVTVDTAPTANAGGPYTGNRTQPVNFDGSGSTDTDGNPLTYSWDFGDGSQGTGARPTHTYASLGTFTVTLVVNDGYLDSAPATTTATITNLAPTVALTAPANGAVFQAPATVTLSASASDPDGTISSVQFFQNSVSLGTLTSAQYTLTWTNVPRGTYALTAVATDNNGAATTSATVSITVRASVMSPAPASVTFSDQVLNTTAPAQTITVTDTGDATLHISSVILSGDPDFSMSSNNCVGGAIAPGGSCSIQVVFGPKSLGQGSATLAIAGDAINSPVSVPLSGNGVNYAPTFSPTSVAFGNVYVGKASGNKTVKLTANGPTALTVSGISVSAGFTQTNNCPASLNKGSSCNITVAFVPKAPGAFNGMLTVSDNGLGSPQTVPLTGNGLDFAISASPSSASVTAGGKATYTVTVSPLGGSYSSNVALTCSGLPTGAKCSFSPSGVSPGSNPVNSTLTVSTTSGSSGTPRGSYVITITGTANNTSHATAVTLVVN